MPSPQHDADVAIVTSLGDPTRQALYRLLVRSGGLMGRDEAATALGIPRPTAAFHLDKLAELGVVEVEYSRRSGATGPGAGRPAKFYRAVVTEVGASVPERHYDLAAQIMIGTLEALGSDTPAVQNALIASASSRGRALATSAPTLELVLEGIGYEPRAEADMLTFDNCPFRRLAKEHTATVCAANHALVQGVLDGRGDDPARAQFVPGAPGCCVQVAR